MRKCCRAEHLGRKTNSKPLHFEDKKKNATPVKFTKSCFSRQCCGLCGTERKRVMQREGWHLKIKEMRLSFQESERKKNKKPKEGHRSLVF